MNNPFIISSCKTYTTYSEFFIVSQNIIAFPHLRWLAAYVPTHHIRRHVLTSSNCDRYMRSAKCTSTDRVIKCDDRPIPISGRSIGASLDVTVPNVPLETCPGSKIVHLILAKYSGEEGCEPGFSVCHEFQRIARSVSFASWDCSGGLC